MNELLKIFTTPRPNGSPSIRQTSSLIQSWLRSRQIPFQIQTYTQYPYFFESIGLWIILTRLLLALSAWLAWGWWIPALAFAGLLGGTLDYVFHIPLVTWPGRCNGENILIQIPLYMKNQDKSAVDENTGTPQNPLQATHKNRDILLSAHYDSKTEPLDHHQRLFFLRSIPAGLIITLLVGLLGILEALKVFRGGWIYWSGAVLSLPLAILAFAYGTFLSTGRLISQSPGAVDDGAACVILLQLAEKIFQMSQDKTTNASIIPTLLTIVLFSGEEIDRQGSRAYVQSRRWERNEVILNLEAMAQDGDYVLWKSDGSIFRQKLLDPRINNLISQAVRKVTSKQPVSGGPVLSDAASFLDAGRGAAVLGTYDRQLEDRGFHRPGDNLERIEISRIQEGVDILISFIGLVLG